MTPTLLSVEIENLNAFGHTSLALDRDRTVIVGPNNSGKTALLTLVDWLLNRATDDELRGGGLRPESQEVLLPARETRNQARRLSIYVRVGGDVERIRYRVITTGGTRGVLRLGLVWKLWRPELAALSPPVLCAATDSLTTSGPPSPRC
jgi:hypothetical protein